MKTVSPFAEAGLEGRPLGARRVDLLQGEDLERSMIKDNTVRIAVGLEHVEDLKADLDQALAQVFG